MTPLRGGACPRCGSCVCGGQCQNINVQPKTASRDPEQIAAGLDLLAELLDRKGYYKWATEVREAAEALRQRMTRESAKALIEDANRWNAAYMQARDDLTQAEAERDALKGVEAANERLLDEIVKAEAERDALRKMLDEAIANGAHNVDTLVAERDALIAYASAAEKVVSTGSEEANVAMEQAWYALPERVRQEIENA